MGRHLRDALPAISSFYQIKKDFVMERKEREVLAAKMHKKQEAAFNKGSKSLPQLEVGDRVRIQNHTTVRTRRWDKTGVVMKILRERQYEILVDGSRRLTVRNRRHLRKVEAPVETREDKEDEKNEV